MGIIIIIIFERITQNNPYVHTHSQKMAKKNNRKRPHQVSATVLCNSILLFFSIWERKEENTVGDLALDTQENA